MADTPKDIDALRNDNLRLVFAKIIADGQAERLSHIRTGLRIVRWGMLGVAVSCIALGGYALWRARAAAPDHPISHWDTVFSTPGVVTLAGVVCVALLVPVLVIERRKTERDIAEHEAFLRSYNRTLAEYDRKATPHPENASEKS